MASLSSMRSIHAAGNSIFSPTHLKLPLPPPSSASQLPLKDSTSRASPLRPLCNFTAPTHTRKPKPPCSPQTNSSQIHNNSYNKTITNPKETSPSPQNLQSPPPIVVDLMSLCNQCKMKEAIDCISQGADANYYVFETLISSCGSSETVELGKNVHELMMKAPFSRNVELNIKLVEMYVKCGNMKSARKVFDRLRERSL